MAPINWQLSRGILFDFEMEHQVFVGRGLWSFTFGPAEASSVGLKSAHLKVVSQTGLRRPRVGNFVEGSLSSPPREAACFRFQSESPAWYGRTTTWGGSATIWGWLWESWDGCRKYFFKFITAWDAAADDDADADGKLKWASRKTCAH